MRSINDPTIIGRSKITNSALGVMSKCSSAGVPKTIGNVNNVPPLVLMRGKSIDYSKFCISSFGEIVYTTENNGYEKSSVQLPRSRQCIYLYPTGAHGGHALLPVNNFKSGVIIRTLKAGDVMKVTPIEVVVQMNRRALMERSNHIEKQICQKKM